MSELILLKVIKDHALGLVVFFIGAFLIGCGSYAINKIRALEHDITQAEATIADLKTQKEVIARALESERKAVSELQALNAQQEQAGREAIRKIKQALKTAPCASKRIPSPILDELRNG